MHIKLPEIPRGKSPNGRPVFVWNDNIDFGLKQIRFEVVNWTKLAQDRLRKSVLNTGVTFRVP
jgi:hypothetical protein